MSEPIPLPNGWASVPLAECANRITDGTHLPPQFVEHGVPFLFVKHIVKGRLTFDDTRFITQEQWQEYQDRCPVEVGDVLYTAVGSYGVAVPVLVDVPFSFQRHIAHIKTNQHLDSKYLAFYLNSPRGLSQAHRVARGVAQKTVTLGDLKQFSVHVAPLAEQRRIVAKIEELFSDLDAGVAALTRAKANLKRYRASVLKAAVEGHLTAAWRVDHPDTEPASTLLARILTERRQNWEADQLAKFAATGKPPPKNWKDKYPEPSPPDTTNLPQLPDGWCWASVAQVASEDDYSLAIGPFGSNLKVSDYTQHGVPLVFVRNIRSGKFNDEGCKFVSSEKAVELDAHSVEGGDVLITKMGDPPGDACLYPLNLPKAIITADCIKVRLHELLPSAEYFVDAINSAVVQSQIQGITKGVAQQKVSLGRFSTVALPLPPVTEQEELVTSISETFSQIKAAEIEIEHGLLRAARLRQSILKQAFEGKLVPQDPADEPAATLLTRLCKCENANAGDRKPTTESKSSRRRTNPSEQ